MKTGWLRFSVRVLRSAVTYTRIDLAGGTTDELIQDAIARDLTRQKYGVSKLIPSGGRMEATTGILAGCAELQRT